MDAIIGDGVDQMVSFDEKKAIIMFFGCTVMVETLIFIEEGLSLRCMEHKNYSLLMMRGL